MNRYITFIRIYTCLCISLTLHMHSFISTTFCSTDQECLTAVVATTTIMPSWRLGTIRNNRVFLSRTAGENYGENKGISACRSDVSMMVEFVVCCWKGRDRYCHHQQQQQYKLKERKFQQQLKEQTIHVLYRGLTPKGNRCQCVLAWLTTHNEPMNDEL